MYFSYFTAKKHLRAWVKHKTGGGPAPTALTDVDQVMLRIFGETPAFKGKEVLLNYTQSVHIKQCQKYNFLYKCCFFIVTGILDMSFDTPIDIPEDTGATTTDAKRCGSKLSKKSSSIAKTLSTTDTIDVQDIFEEAREIRALREQIAENNKPKEVAGTNIFFKPVSLVKV